MRIRVYKCRVGDFADGKASVMGEYVPARLGMDAGERPVYMALTEDYAGHMLFLFENGKCAKVPMQSYATKQNRKKLLNAYSDKAKLVWAACLPEETELAITTSAGRMLLVHSAQIPEKQTKNTAGVGVLTLKKNQHITGVRLAAGLELADAHRYRACARCQLWGPLCAPRTPWNRQAFCNVRARRVPGPAKRAKMRRRAENACFLLGDMLSYIMLLRRSCCAPHKMEGLPA